MSKHFSTFLSYLAAFAIAFVASYFLIKPASVEVKPVEPVVVQTPAPAPSAGEHTLTAILERGELRIGLDAGYEPFEMRNKKGEIIGFDIDMMAAAAKSMGVKLTVVNTAWDGIIPALLTRKFDVIAAGMTVTQERNLKVNFSHPYIHVGQTILLRKGLKDEVKSYKDLNHKKYTVAAKLGTTGEQAVRRMIPRAKLITYESQQEAALEVISGRIDAFVYDLPFQSLMASDKGKGKLIHLNEPFTFEPLALAIRQSDPNFLNWLNNFLYQIKHDGTYDKIYAKWFQSVEWKKEMQ